MFVRFASTPCIHKHHGVELLEKAVESAKDEILTLPEMTKKRIKTFHASIRQIEEMEAEIQANVASSKREVSHRGRGTWT